MEDYIFHLNIINNINCINSFIHSSTLPNGTYYFRVKAADTLGNESAYSTAGSVEVDSTLTSGPTSLGPTQVTAGTYKLPNKPYFSFVLSFPGADKMTRAQVVKEDVIMDKYNIDAVASLY